MGNGRSTAVIRHTLTLTPELWLSNPHTCGPLNPVWPAVNQHTSCMAGNSSHIRPRNPHLPAISVITLCECGCGCVCASMFDYVHVVNVYV